MHSPCTGSVMNLAGIPWACTATPRTARHCWTAYRNWSSTSWPSFPRTRTGRHNCGARPTICASWPFVTPTSFPLLVTRPLSTPLGLRPLGTSLPLEQILSLLIDADFSPADALHVYRAY